MSDLGNAEAKALEYINKGRAETGAAWNASWIGVVIAFLFGTCFGIILAVWF